MRSTGAMHLQEPTDPGDRPTGPDSANERTYPPAALREDFRAGRHLMDMRVGRVRELVGQEPARSTARRRATFWKFSGEDGGAFAVTMTSAPTAARATRLSTDIFSGSTQTSR